MRMARPDTITFPSKYTLRFVVIVISCYEKHMGYDSVLCAKKQTLNNDNSLKIDDDGEKFAPYRIQEICTVSYTGQCLSLNYA